MNQQLVDSLFQVIQALSPDEQAVLVEKLGGAVPEPTPQELVQLAQTGGALEFLNGEPNLYTLADGEPLS